MINPGRTKLFLSHAHKDAEEAQWLRTQLRVFFKIRTGRSLEVFLTSEPASTFKPGDQSDADLRAAVRRHKQELEEYLLQHLSRSAAFLVLVTPGSVDREWIRWEIQEAGRLADQDRILFVPCLLRVEKHELHATARQWAALRSMKQSGVTLWEQVSDVPSPGAEARLEDAVLLHEDGGIDRLVDKLADALGHRSADRRRTETL